MTICERQTVTWTTVNDTQIVTWWNIHGSLQTRIIPLVFHQNINKIQSEAGSCVFGAARLDFEELLSFVDARTTQQGYLRLSQQISRQGFDNKYISHTMAVLYEHCIYIWPQCLTLHLICFVFFPTATPAPSQEALRLLSYRWVMGWYLDLQKVRRCHFGTSYVQRNFAERQNECEICPSDNFTQVRTQRKRQNKWNCCWLRYLSIIH